MATAAVPGNSKKQTKGKTRKVGVPEKCPFDKHHIMSINESRIQSHLSKCRDRYMNKVIESGKPLLQWECQHKCGKSLFGPELSYHERHCHLRQSGNGQKGSFIDKFVGTTDHFNPFHPTLLLHPPSFGKPGETRENFLFDETEFETMLMYEHYGAAGLGTRDIAERTNQINNVIKPRFQDSDRSNNNLKLPRSAYDLTMSEKQKIDLFKRVWKTTLGNATDEKTVPGITTIQAEEKSSSSKTRVAASLDW